MLNVENFVAELERLYFGELTPDRFHAPYREVSMSDAIGAFVNLRFVFDQFGDLLGVVFECVNDYGHFTVDSLNCTVSNGLQKVQILPEIAEEISEMFQEIYLG